METVPVTAYDKNSLKNYCAALVNPFDEHINARIPDMCTLPSRVVALYQEGSFPLNANGDGGIQLSINQLPSGTVIGFEDGALTSAGNIVFQSAGTLPGQASVTSSLRAARVVSGGVKIQYAGNDQANQGLVYATTGSRFELTSTSPSITDISSQRLNGFGPSKFGAYAVWRPVDNKDKEYASSNTFAGRIQMHVTGGAPLAVFMYKAVVHYEMLPAADTENGPGDLGRSPYHDTSRAEMDIENQYPAIDINVPGRLERGAQAVARAAEQAVNIAGASYQQAVNFLQGRGAQQLGGVVRGYQTRKRLRSSGVLPFAARKRVAYSRYPMIKN